jgi:hypothetical protein
MESVVMNIGIQPDLFPNTARDPVLGLTARLQKPCRCGSTLATIGAGKGPHAVALYCEQCAVHRGWASHETHRFLTEIIKNFGLPTEPVTIKFG